MKILVPRLFSRGFGEIPGIFSSLIGLWIFCFLPMTLQSVKAQIPTQIKPDTSVQQGLLTQCFILKDGNTKRVSEFKPKIPYQVEVVPSLNLANYLRNFSFPGAVPFFMVVKGELQIPASKSYLFKLRSSDGAVFWLDGKRVVSNDGPHEVTETEAEYYLEAGLHTLEIQYFKLDPGKYKELTLWWNQGPDGKMEYIPAEHFQVSKKLVRQASSGKKVLTELDMRSLGMEFDRLHPGLTKFRLHKADFQPKVGGMDFMRDGSLIVSTWDSLGAVYRVKNVLSHDTQSIVIQRIAWGLAEPLGLKVVDDRIFVLQKQELTELIDENGDGMVDVYRTVCNGWGATGNFHEFAFGLVYKDGYFYAGLAIAIQPGGKSTIPQHKDRGKVIKMGMDGSFEFVASGLRTPNGFGIGVDNEIFIADNQGDWLPSCKILHLKPKAFFGNYSVDLYNIGKYKEQAPVVWLPQNEIGNSASQPAVLNMGPYRNQMVHGDVTHGGLKRVFVEKVKGEYQGVVFPFTQGLEGGTNRLIVGPDSNLYVGMIGNPGNWGHSNHEWFGLEALKWNGKKVFDVLAIRSLKRGFEMEFTEPIPAGTAWKKLLTMASWTYTPTMKYGGPKENLEEFSPEHLWLSPDRKHLVVEIRELKEGYVYHFDFNDSLKATDGRMLCSSSAWYTLNQISEEQRNFKQWTQVLKPAPKAGKPAIKVSGAKPTVVVMDAKTEAAAILEGSKLVQPSGCMACHKENDKVLGPSFRDVARKYKSDLPTVKKLVEKVYNGGSGVWGDYAMAAQSHLKKDQIEKMVRWVLSLK
jgi:cytochrome c